MFSPENCTDLVHTFHSSVIKKIRNAGVKQWEPYKVERLQAGTILIHPERSLLVENIPFCLTTFKRDEPTKGIILASVLAGML